ncbi:hypothetical protein Pryu01_02400 [Paraliobacillus ryukyuensis]|uniref:5,10-methylene-tetrahydrofolate dehydrogenase n=1 Tax=Paraliobacillus ryukyuensis TaxID=200904 RepID=A0A366DWY8_9BACI|nr:hypothetical protein [Paraliobacillus ryukyuensis]RBO94616.1 hypothetical protein DES48_110103 [Paraliobacillus ryukyuensis]
MEKLTVGIICAPELPTKITKEILEELKKRFAQSVSNQIEWELDYKVDQLTGAAEQAHEIFDTAEKLKRQNNWNYVICLTDLPKHSVKHETVLADLDFDKRIGQISLPAFGFPPMKNRVKKSIIQVMQELYQANTLPPTTSNFNENKIKRQFPFSSIKKTHDIETESNVDARYLVIPAINGKLRVLAGMTFANRPWLLLTSFKPIIAVAFGTGAYSIIFTTLWQLSVNYSIFRLAALMLVSCISMIIWMIISHDLWEKPTKKGKKRIRILYNTATIFTLLIGVLVFYLILLVFFSIAIMVFVPPEMFKSVTELEGNVTLFSFLRLSWLGTSVAILAGAIGAGSANPEIVRNIAYGYRQYQRYKELQVENEKNTKEKTAE